MEIINKNSMILLARLPMFWQFIVIREQKMDS